jgi:hypothetical protein
VTITTERPSQQTAESPEKPRLHDRLLAAWPGLPLSCDPTGITGWTYPWLLLSLAFAVFCGAAGMRFGFMYPNTVQDDSRTFLFWMARFTDPSLFPNDLIASYFEAVSPPGYTAVNWVSAVVFGLDPFTLNKLLPLVLGLITTVYVFRLTMVLLPVPAGAFAAATILNESIWLSDALTSGTPRAFIYPIFAAFLFYLATGRAYRMLAAVALLGLFYPQILTIAVGLVGLRLIRIEGGRVGLSRRRRDYLLLAGAVLVALPSVAWAGLLSAEYGPTVTAAQARQMVEFGPLGRTRYFTTNAWRFWVTGERSGILPFSVKPPFIWLGLLLPGLVLFRRHVPLAARLSPKTSLLARLTVVSFGMYAAAHLLLFRLHLPSRYTQHSLRFVLALGAGLALVLLLDLVLGALRRLPSVGGAAHGVAAAVVLAVVFGAVLLYPAVYPLTNGSFPYMQYVVGRETGLYDFLEKTPKDTVVASMATQVDLIPSMAKRSIFNGYEYAIPYHVGYYSQLRMRTHDLLRMEYALDPAEVRRFFTTYRVTYLLLDRSAYVPEYVERNLWITQTQPEATQAYTNLTSGNTPIVAKAMQQCQVFSSARYVLLDGVCIARYAGG